MSTKDHTLYFYVILSDCTYLADNDYKSGVHALNIGDEEIEGFCDIRKDDSSWLVIQRRVDDNVNFWKGWKDYKNGK